MGHSTTEGVAWRHPEGVLEPLSHPHLSGLKRHVDSWESSPRGQEGAAGPRDYTVCPLKLDGSVCGGWGLETCSLPKFL